MTLLVSQAKNYIKHPFSQENTHTFEILMWKKQKKYVKKLITNGSKKKTKNNQKNEKYKRIKTQF